MKSADYVIYAGWGEFTASTEVQQCSAAHPIQMMARLRGTVILILINYRLIFLYFI
jgi:hypothetical protein